MAWYAFEKMLNDVESFEGRDANYKNVLTEQFNIGIISFHQVHMHLNVLDQPLNFIKIY